MNDAGHIKPYKESDADKKAQVAEMFDNIAHRYDFLNHFFSLGIDIRWRKRVIKMLKGLPAERILDVATGTGDMAFELMELEPTHLDGVDISAGMLDIGKQKIKKRGLEDRMTFTVGDSEDLGFDDDSFDIVTVSFGVRNFAHLDKGLRELNRVTKGGGKLCILEFSKPEKFPLKQLFGFYFKFIMPVVGRLVSKDNAAYTYLPESVKAFPYGDAFAERLKHAGFQSVVQRPVTGGIATIYLASN